MNERAPAATGHEQPAAKMAQCRACGAPKPVGKFTCLSCGRTSWAPIAVLFAAAGVAKAGAVWCGLGMRNGWLSSSAAWGGSLLAAYFLLGAVGGIFDALRTRRAASLGPPEPGGSVLRGHAYRVGEAYFLLVACVGFVVIGNAVDPVVGVCLAFALSLLGVAILLSKAWSSALSAAKRELPVRLIAAAENRPVITPVSGGILTPEAGLAVTKGAPALPAGAEADPGAEVTLRVSCAGNRFAAGLDATAALDGQPIGIGTLRRGFDVRCGTEAGAHELQVRWGFVTQRFALYFPLPGVYVAELRHSRFWGKFFPVDGRDQE
jgi:hypothetical protein